MYQERDIEAAARQVLQFRREPRWFVGFPRAGTRQEFDEYWARAGSGKFLHEATDGPCAVPSPPAFPRAVTDVPLEQHGARLTLAISPTDDPKILRMRLALTAGQEPIVRQVEHRASNTLPFLFAFFVDSKAVVISDESVGKIGGAESLMPLVEAGQTQEWNIRVDSDSLRRIMPDSRSHTVSIVAAFSNSQHQAPSLGAAPTSARLEPEAKPMLIRSQAANLKWDAAAQRWLND